MLTSKKPLSSPFHRSLWTSILGLLITCVCASWLPGCEGCSETPMATLSARKGAVDRDTKAKIEKWLAAEIGATFAVGDGIRTGKKSGAQLTMDDGSVLALEEDTLIRFLDRAPGSNEQALDLQLGSASLEASAEGAVLKTLFGQATLEGGTKVQLKRSGDDFRFRIKVGSATLEGGDGKKLEVTAGQTIEITMGGAVMEVLEEEEEPEEAVVAEEDDKGPSGPITANISGATVRMKGPGEKEFQKLEAGDATLSAGTTLEVGAGSSVNVAQGDNRAQLASGGTYVIGAGEQLVSAQSGSVQVSSEGKVEIKVPGGVIVTSGGSSTITALGKDGTRVKANSGAVTLKGKTEETLSTGQEGILSLDGDVSVKGGGVAYADVETTVGENMVVHDPRPPTAVRFLFGDECQAGTIRLKGTKKSVPADNYGSGDKSVSLLLGPGKTSYSLHCIDEDGKEGPAKVKSQVTILRDAGSRPVPKKAPSTFVEVNGRAYTVLYQNQLPQVTFKWSKAPPGAALKLHVRSGGRSRVLSANGNTYSFRSGSLGEGTHRVYFDGGGRVSRQTSITILFDNATPTASLSTPALSGKAGSDVTLAGTALPGWGVEVDGKSIGQDAGARFSVKTKVPDNGRPVSVRLTHPTRGTHIYLRRTSSE